MNASRCPDLGNWFFFLLHLRPPLSLLSLLSESSSSLRDLTLPMLVRSINARLIPQKGFPFSENRNVWKWSSRFVTIAREISNLFKFVRRQNIVYIKASVCKNFNFVIEDVSFTFLQFLLVDFSALQIPGKKKPKWYVIMRKRNQNN